MSSFSSLGAADLGAKATRDAAREAAKVSLQIAGMNRDLIIRMYEEGKADMLPFLLYGKNALSGISDVDPTGGMQKYLDQLDALDYDFKFDENDPIYKWRQSENDRRVNQAFASRGGYDSRAAVNTLLSSGMQLQEGEINRQQNQYNQRYLQKFNKLTSLAGLSSQKGQLQYNKLLDAIKIGTGQSQAAGQLGANAASKVSDVYSRYSQDAQNSLLQQGAATANFYSQAGQNQQNAGNALLSYFLNK